MNYRTRHETCLKQTPKENNVISSINAIYMHVHILINQFMNIDFECVQRQGLQEPPTL